MGDSGGNWFAALILGVFILMAAVVFTAPEHADEAWEFAMSIVWWIGVCLVIVVVGFVLIFVLAILMDR